MKVWILGAQGQMGCSLIDVCHHLKIPVTAMKRKEVDICNLEQLKKVGDQVDCTHILNCAAFTDVDGAEKESQLAFAVNAIGAENLAIVAREKGVKLVHISTDYVFDGEKETPYLETDLPNPLSIYGQSKWEGEERVFSELPTACIVRTSWIFGRQGKNFISSVLSLLKQKEQILAAKDQVNRATYNRDLAMALLDIASHSGIFHFANDGPVSRYQIVQDFHAEARRRGAVLKCKEILPASAADFPTPSPRPANSILSTDKIELVLGRKPRMWKTVLSEYLDHVLPHK